MMIDYTFMKMYLDTYKTMMIDYTFMKMYLDTYKTFWDTYK